MFTNIKLYKSNKSKFNYLNRKKPLLVCIISLSVLPAFFTTWPQINIFLNGSFIHVRFHFYWWCKYLVWSYSHLLVENLFWICCQFLQKTYNFPILVFWIIFFFQNKVKRSKQGALILWFWFWPLQPCLHLISEELNVV